MRTQIDQQLMNLKTATQMYSSSRATSVARLLATLAYRTAIQHQSSYSSNPRVTKTYHEIPTNKSFLPSQLGLILSGGPGYLHEHCDKRHRQLGPIFREKLGSTELVFIADTDMMRTVIANEGIYPHHNVPEAWLLYNQVKGLERGLFFQIGEPWLKLRRVFNKALLSDPRKITRSYEDILALNADLLKSWTGEFKTDPNSASINVMDVKAALCKWSIEATGLMLFGQRMGCVPVAGLDSAESSRAEHLVRSISDMFHQTSKFQLIPPELAMKFNLPSWKKFEIASNDMIKIASAYATAYISRVEHSNSKASIVADLLKTRSLTVDEISRTMVDLIIAGADTTPNSLQWIFYALAKNPHVQSKVRDEIKLQKQSRVGPDGIDHTNKHPYRHAVIKEALRLYPTAPFLARTLDHSISLGGYEIPAKRTIVFSLFTTSRNEKYFREPHLFKPERWLRNNDSCKSSDSASGKKSAFASLPFGIGSRMCIGRRMADLEMDLLVASVVEKYELRLSKPEQEIKIKLKMILKPSKPISLQMKPMSDIKSY